jgi:hypothetical protein
LAALADDLVTFQRAQLNGPTTSSLAAATLETTVEAVVAAVMARRDKQARSRTQDNNGGVCYFHKRFGNAARNCRPPCSKNGQAGSQH